MKGLLTEVMIKDMYQSSDYWANVRIHDIDHPMGYVKCVINIFSDKRKVAFGSFHLSPSYSHFEGMKVHRGYRGHSIANVAMELYLKVSDILELSPGKTSPQNKPDICFILTQYGMSPCSGQKKYEISVLPKNEGSDFRIYFPNPAAKSKFMRTNIYQSGSYSIIDKLPIDSSTTTIIVGSNYALSDSERFRNRRVKNLERFAISFQSLESISL